MKHFSLFLFLLFPLPALAGLTVSNCDDAPHRGEVVYNGETVAFELLPGKNRIFSGIPKELRVGTDVSFGLRPDDEWCIWGKDNVHLQRRHRTHGRTR